MKQRPTTSSPSPENEQSKASRPTQSSSPIARALLAGLMQAIMLPMLGFAALYFRRTATDPRLAPGKAWDAMLVISCLGLLIAGVWGVVSKFF